MLVGDYFNNQNSIYGADILIADNPEYLLLEKFSDIYVEIDDKLKSGGFFGIRDDFQFFDANKSNLTETKCGKLMIIDKDDFNIHHIFFDDEITMGDNCCVDIWDIGEKKRVSIQESYEKFLFEVDPIEAILNPDYFINAFNKCVKKREEDIENPDEILKDNRVSYDYLKICKPSEYLENTVFPLLLPAFKVIEEQRPYDPLNYLAVYLLQNKDRIYIPKRDVKTNPNNPNLHE